MDSKSREPCSASSMADAIAALYDRDLDEMGATARLRVLRKFTWQKAFQAQTTAYASLVGGRRLPVPEDEMPVCRPMALRSPTSFGS